MLFPRHRNIFRVSYTVAKASTGFTSRRDSSYVFPTCKDPSDFYSFLEPPWAVGTVLFCSWDMRLHRDSVSCQALLRASSGPVSSCLGLARIYEGATVKLYNSRGTHDAGNSTLSQAAVSQTFFDIPSGCRFDARPCQRLHTARLFGPPLGITRV